jgi:ferrochelatase
MKGIVLINLGSPKDLELSSIKSYLKEFLSDDYVLDIPKLIQRILVNFIIVPFRSSKTKKAYESIWTSKGSPLIVNTNLIAKKLQKKMNLPIEVAMRYQEPSIRNAILKLLKNGCDEIIATPLYPHYAQATSLTTHLEVERVMKDIDPSINFSISSPFYSEYGYIKSLSESIKNYLPSEFDYLLFSYHGIPERHVKKMDPTLSHCLSDGNCCSLRSKAHKYCYKHQVLETSKLCADDLGLNNDQWGVSFQSRIGPGWLQPFTDKVLEEFPKNGIKKIAVVCPAFIADNLETLEEVDIRARETFLDSGGDEFTFIPCINDNELWIDFLANFIEK